MEKINEAIDIAIDEIKTEFCSTYGADPEGEDAEDINANLSEFVEELLFQAMENVRKVIQENLNVSPKEGSLASIEAKLNLLLGGAQNIAVKNEGRAVVVPTKTNDWARYQKAWYKYKQNLVEEVPKHAGERSRLCASEYKKFKNLSDREREEFLNEWS